VLTLYKEGMKCEGYFKFEFFQDGQFIGDTDWIKNQLTVANREYRQSMLDGSAVAKGYDIDDLRIRYIALGDGLTLATINDTQLENELFRRAVTSVVTVNGETQAITVFPPPVANFRIREIGVFCRGANDQANSGLMISRINVDVTKTSNITMNVVRMDRTVI